MTEFRFDDIVDISRVGLLYDKIGPSIKDTSSISLDLSAINHIDCAGIQLIYAFTESARKQGIEVELKQASETLLTAAGTLGLADYFQPAS